MDDPTDMKLEFAGPPRVKVFLPEVLGDIWFEFKCEVDQRPNPCDPPPFVVGWVGVWLECAVWPWWLWADGLNKIKFLSDFCEPKELSDVVFEFKPVQRADSCVRFLLKLPALYPPFSFGVGLYCLNQSGIFKRWRDACTRNWCSLNAVEFSCVFRSSFSGGWKEEEYFFKLVFFLLFRDCL